MANSFSSFPALLVALLFCLAALIASAQLSSTFYNTSCPNTLSIIQSAVKSAVSNERRMGASLLRLHFHDCFVQASLHIYIYIWTFIYIIYYITPWLWWLWCCVNVRRQGCDGSVLLDDTSSFTGEKTAAPNNNSLRGFDVVDDIKSKLESSCKQVVSCADILAVAARDAVVAVWSSAAIYYRTIYALHAALD